MLRDSTVTLLILSGLILLCCEAETIGLQLACALCGFTLWGLAWICWQGLERSCQLIRKAMCCIKKALEEEIKEERNKAA